MSCLEYGRIAKKISLYNPARPSSLKTLQLTRFLFSRVDCDLYIKCRITPHEQEALLVRTRLWLTTVPRNISLTASQTTKQGMYFYYSN